MDFKKFNKGRIGLILTCLLVVVYFISCRIFSSHADASSMIAYQATPPKPVMPLLKENLESNDAQDKEISDQIEKDRQEQWRIKDLKMQREETDLQLEEQKALSELNKLKRNTASDINDPSISNTNMDIKIMYVGGGIEKEAILSINGIDYAVKPKDRPLKSLEVMSITNNAVSVRFLTPPGTTEVYPFKSE